MPELRIRPGGLFRCCLKSLEEAPTDPGEGDVFRCKYCTDEFGMRYRHGAWEWAKD